MTVTTLGVYCGIPVSWTILLLVQICKDDRLVFHHMRSVAVSAMVAVQTKLNWTRIENLSVSFTRNLLRKNQFSQIKLSFGTSFVGHPQDEELFRCHSVQLPALEEWGQNHPGSQPCEHCLACPWKLCLWGGHPDEELDQELLQPLQDALDEHVVGDALMNMMLRMPSMKMRLLRRKWKLRPGQTMQVSVVLTLG